MEAAAICSHLSKTSNKSSIVFFHLPKINAFLLRVLCLNRFSIQKKNEEKKNSHLAECVYVSTSVIQSISLIRSINLIQLDRSCSLHIRLPVKYMWFWSHSLSLFPSILSFMFSFLLIVEFKHVLHKFTHNQQYIEHRIYITTASFSLSITRRFSFRILVCLLNPFLHSHISVLVRLVWLFSAFHFLYCILLTGFFRILVLIIDDACVLNLSPFLFISLSLSSSLSVAFIFSRQLFSAFQIHCRVKAKDLVRSLLRSTVYVFCKSNRFSVVQYYTYNQFSQSTVNSVFIPVFI